MSMNWADYLEAIEINSNLLAAAAKKGLGAAAPSCPGWTVHDVVEHVGRIHRTKFEIVSRELQDGQDDADAPLAAEGDLIDWFAEGAELLLSALQAADPATPVWTWDDSNKTVGFWYRRMAHETLIHRVDAEQAHGPVTSADPELCSDGIDEFMITFIGGAPDWATIEQGEGAIAISTPERKSSYRRDYFSGTTLSGRVIEQDWFYDSVDTGTETACTVKGSSQAINLWLWGRGTAEDLDISGDARIAKQLREDAAEAAG